MKGKTLFAVAAMSLILFGAVFASAAEAKANRNQKYQEKQESSGFGNGNIIRLMQRIRNQIRDTLGICNGECNLTEITGFLEYSDNIYSVDDVEVHFGPYWYITNTQASFDFDGDGSLEPIFDELQGLVGSEVTLEGHLQSDNWLSVFYINGELYREPGKPIWSGGNNAPN